MARPPNIINEVDLTLLQLDEQGIDRLLPEIAQVKLRREGSLYWLSVSLPPDRVWPIVRDFWLEQGFGIEIEIPEAGVFETNWRQDRSKVLGTGLTRFLDAGAREPQRHRRALPLPDAHRARSRRRRQHRDLHQLPAPSRSSPTASSRRCPATVTLETEMLRRMMLKFRLPGEDIASIEDFVNEASVDDLYVRDGSILAINRGPRRGLAPPAAGPRTAAASPSSNRTRRPAPSRSSTPIRPSPRRSRASSAACSAWGQDDGESFEADLQLDDASAEQTIFAFPEGEIGDRILAILVTNI